MTDHAKLLAMARQMGRLATSLEQLIEGMAVKQEPDPPTVPPQLQGKAGAVHPRAPVKK